MKYTNFKYCSAFYVQWNAWLSLLVLMTFLVLSVIFKVYAVTHKPDFASMQVQERKEAFTKMMLPLIRATNTQVMSQRTQLEKLANKKTFSSDEIKCLQKLGSDYKLPLHDATPSKTWFVQMLMRVDILPPSLMFVQAATESAWGSSRFAVEGNNYYGMWCYSKGCGIVPRKRSPGDINEVRSFNSVQDSVDAYLANINIHSFYAKLRDIRANQRTAKKSLNSLELVEGLDRYAQTGSAYVESLSKWIKRDHLQKFDEHMVTIDKTK